MKRIKRCWHIFVLCFIFSLTAAVFISCGPDFDADAKEDQTVVDDSATTTPPTENPTEPTNPDLPSHEHHYGDWEIDTAATCTQPQIEKRTCAECGKSETHTIGEPLAHDYNTEEQPATCTAAGSIKYTCLHCGDSYTDTIPATGHDYTATVVEPTCTENGYTLHECKNCHDSYTDNITPATGHEYETHGNLKTCTKCEISETLPPIENPEGSYWYLTYVDAYDNLVKGKWAIYFETFDTDTNKGTYCSYRYQLENGNFVKGDKFNKYYGTYKIIKVTDHDKGITYYSIKFEDTYCKDKIAAKEEEYLYPTFTLEYHAEDNHYQLTGSLISFENGTLIFAGYDL